MRDDLTKYRSLSLAGHPPRISPVDSLWCPSLHIFHYITCILAHDRYDLLDTVLAWQCTDLEYNLVGKLYGWNVAVIFKCKWWNSCHEIDDARCSGAMQHQAISWNYRKTSSISRTKSPNLNVSCIALQLSLPNPLKPGVKLRMKM